MVHEEIERESLFAGAEASDKDHFAIKIADGLCRKITLQCFHHAIVRQFGVLRLSGSTFMCIKVQ